MMSIRVLESIVADQQKSFREKNIGIKRSISFDRYISSSPIVVISGIRRCGKSTLLRQFSEYFSSYYFFTFDDERLLKFEVDDFQHLMIAFQKLYPARTLLLDEIQNIPKWERFIRRVHDEGYKIFITGSNAGILSSELATHITGRYVKIELYPFSFEEIVRYRGIDTVASTTEKTAHLLTAFDWYLEHGGFPEYVVSLDDELVKRIYDDIISRDLILRFKIRDVRMFKELAQFLLTNVTQEMSYYSLKKALEIKSITSVKNYLEHMSEGFLIYPLHQYAFSLKKQVRAPRKIYAIDNGLRNAVAFSFSPDRGRLLENTVSIELRRRGMEIYYFREKYECDFLIKKKNAIVQAIQVTTSIDRHNKDRELQGLMEALKIHHLKEGMILVDSGEYEIMKIDKLTIRIVPAWRWLLGQDG
jgi:predicted AAA+ superfamily ATPase